MTGIFTGLGAGAERGSASVLGGVGLLGSASFGRSAEQVMLNAATGNLMLQQRDEMLVGLGPDAVIGRTYNSLGDLSDENGDNWRQSTDRRITDLTGTLNTAGATAKRVSADGSVIVYTYRTITRTINGSTVSESAYFATDGAGAYDKLEYNASSVAWKWTDGDSQITEIYDHVSGSQYFITAMVDTVNNTLKFSYLSGTDKIDKVTTANGEFTQYGWSGNTITWIKTGYTDLDTNTAKTLTRTQYSYDEYGRFKSAKIDHSPDDNNIDDQNVYKTTHTYVGTTKLVETIKQSDGSSLTIGYDASNRVHTLTQLVAGSTTRVTTIDYYSGYTTITDDLGQVTRLDYDSAGNLTEITLPPTSSGATPQTSKFDYNANGDVTSVKDAFDNATTYADFTALGQARTITDRLSHVTTRTFGAKNELLTETVTGSDPASSGASHTTRYVYDAQNLLNYRISADGRVTTYIHGAASGAVSKLSELSTDFYPTGSLSFSASVSMSDMDTWIAGLTHPEERILSKFTYDARGNLLTQTDYAGAGEGGAVVAAMGYRKTSYVYDQAGQMLKRTVLGETTETFAYDALGRLILSTDVNGATTDIHFYDSTTTTVVTLANGFVRTSTYNKAGELVDFAESGTGIVTGTAHYTYDKLGRLRMTTDATGHNSYVIYDGAGRDVGHVDHYGRLTEYKYDANNRLIATIVYANTLASKLTQLQDATQPYDLNATGNRPTASSGDLWTWRVYDADDRLIETINGDGAVTQYQYDASDRVIATIGYAKLLTAGQIATIKATPPTSLLLPAPDTDKDAVARTFYDKDGHVVGKLDGEGYLSEVVYDAAGQITRTIAYATKVANATLRATGTLADLRANRESSADRTTRYIYDGEGLLRYQIDALNHVIGYNYQTSDPSSEFGPCRVVTQYYNPIAALSFYSVATVQAAITASNANDRSTYSVYDNAGRAVYTIDPVGAVTALKYDTMGRVIRKTRYAAARETTSLPTLGDMDTWTSAHDSDSTSAHNRITRNFYDLRGNLAYSVDGEKYVTRFEYDTENRMVSTTRWDAAVTATITDTTTLLALAGYLTGATTATATNYDYDGRVETVTDGEGAVTKYVYNANGTLESTYTAYVDMLGTGDEARTYFLYDAAGRVRSRYDAYGAAGQALTTYTYTAFGQVETTTDPNLNGVTNVYDLAGRLVSVTDAENPSLKTSYQYNAFGEVKVATDRLLKSSYTYYDTMGRVIATRDADNRVVETAYNNFGEISSITARANLASGSTAALPGVTPDTARDHVTTYDYDKNGQVVTTTDIENGATTITYTTFGEVKTLVSPLTATTSIQTTSNYDRRGLLKEQIVDSASGGKMITTLYEYDSFGRQTKVTNTLTKFKRASYDKDGRLKTTWDEFDNATTYTYDKRGNLVAVSEPAGRVTRYVYDKNDRRIGMIDAVGAVTTYSYDNNGNVTVVRTFAQKILSTTLANFAPQVTSAVWSSLASDTEHDHVTRYAYDKDDRLRFTVDALGHTIERVYDAEGNVRRTIAYDGKIAPGSYAVDAIATAVASQAPRVTRFVYDPAGQVMYSIDALNRVTGYGYDAFGNVVRTTEFAATYTADGDPSLPAMNTWAGTPNTDNRITLAKYDRDGRLRYSVDALGYVTRFDYDKAGHVSKRIAYLDPNTGIDDATTLATLDGTTYATISDTARVTQYGYDRAGRLISTTLLEDGAGGRNTDSITTYLELDALGRILSSTEGYNLANPSDLTNASTTAYEYDDAGRVVKQVAASGRAGASTTWFYYDALGRRTATVDGDKYLCVYVYDAAGQLTHETHYAGKIAGTFGKTTSVASLIGLAGSVSSDAQTDYDAFGAVAATTDARLSVVSYDYDSIGELKKQAVQMEAGTTDDIVTQYIYDNFGNVVKTIDARGNASFAYYDALDRVTRQVDAERFVTDTTYTRGDQIETVTRWHNALDDSVTVTELTKPDHPGAHALDATTSFAYDKADRLWKAIAAEGDNSGGSFQLYYEQYTLDAFGNRVAVRNKLGATSTYTFDKRGQVLTETLPISTWTGGTSPTSLAVKNVYTYDLRGNRKTMEEASGAAEMRTTSYDYDVQDRLIKTTHDKVTVTNVDLTQTGNVDPVETILYDHRGNVIATTDAAGGTTWMVYDSLSRKVAQIDPMGAVQTWAYDTNGNVTAMRAYPTPARLPSDAGTIELQIRRMYDVTLGRQPFQSEIDSWSSRMTSNPGPNPLTTAFGEILGDAGVQVRFPSSSNDTAFVQSVYRYAFQREAAEYEVNAWLNNMAAGWTRPQVLAFFSEYAEHIPLNLQAMIAEQAAAVAATAGYRETTYGYDRADRLRTTTVANLRVGEWDGSAWATATGNVVTSVEYDMAGNVTRQTDGRGNSIYTWYDRLGRKIAQVDAENYLTTWTLDAEGNALNETRYAATVGAVSSATDPATLRRPWYSSAGDRITQFTYDRVGRRLTERRFNVDNRTVAANGALVGSPYLGGNIDPLSQAAQIMRMYDVVLGRPPFASEIELWTSYLNAHQNDAQPAAENWGNYTSLFPGINMKAVEAMAASILGDGGVRQRLGGPADADFVAQLYRAAFRRDATASEISGWTSALAGGWTRGGMLAFFSELVDHRVLTDTGIKAGTIYDNWAASTIAYTYNGLGEVLTKVEANGDATGYAYDATGRLTLETGASFTGSDGATVTPRTAYVYDGLNNLRSTRVQAAATASDANDRITTYTYGAGGRLASITDAANFTHTYGYDVMGRTVLDQYVRTKSDASSVTEAIVYRYDLAGRVTIQTNARLSGSAWVYTSELAGNPVYDAVRMRYNAYGEMTGRGVTAGPGAAAAYQELFDYDAGGRLWHANSGDGVDRFYVYDKAGNQTLVLTSTGADLSALTLANYTTSLTSTGDTSTAGAVTTITFYDKNGQATATLAPDRELTAIGSGTVTLATAKTYNAFGEVSSETDARGYTTSFTYNTMGRMTQKVSPQVSVTAENGAVSTVAPTENYFYDLSGRMVAATDANGHVTSRLLLAGTGHGSAEALVTREFHADGGIAETRYDVFGDARGYINELGFTTLSDYDKLSRLITVTHPQRAAGTPGNESGAAQQLVDHYTYDSLGQRIGHWNSQFTSTYVERTDYDAKGRVVATVNFAGDAMNYAYSAFTGSIATSGLGTFGGWTRTTTNAAASVSMTDKTDYFGRTVDTVDYGAHDYDLGFDKGGRLVMRTNAGGESIGYSWYNSGLAAGQTGTQGTAGYTYDANGDRLAESLAKGGTTYRTASASYDALGRMTHWEDQAAALGGSSGAPVRTDWKYDAAGNVRRATSYYAEITSAGGIGAVITSPKDNWYTYDSMNRELITQGTFTGSAGSGSIGRGATGTSLTWNLDGTRATATTTTTGLMYRGWKVTPHGAGQNPNNWIYLDLDSEDLDQYQQLPESYTVNAYTLTTPYDAETRETYSYTADGQLAGVSTAWQRKTASGQSIVWANGGGLGDAVQTTWIGRDALGRITHYLESGAVTGNGYYERRGANDGDAIVYDRANRELGETSFSGRSDGVYKTVLTNTYTGGRLTRQQQQNFKGDVDSAAADTDQTYSYAWWDGAIQSGISYDNDTSAANTLWTTDYALDSSGHVTSAAIRDGQWRDVAFTTDQNGMVVDRTETKITSGGHNTTTNGNPRSLHYMFGGQQIGTASNNGTDNTSYALAIRARLTAGPANPGPFANGSGTASAAYDFDQNYDAINGSSVASTGGSYTAQGGETLATIAQQLWGDAGLWYLLADANGLPGAAELTAGQTITVPNKVINRHNNADTFRPYDPNEALGDTSPTSAAKPPTAKKGNNCGIIGAILLVVVAVAVTIATHGFTSGLFASSSTFTTSSLTLASGMVVPSITVVGPATLSAAGAIAAGATAAIAGAVASQAVGLVTGIQQKFDWKGVALAGISGGIGAGLGQIGVLSGGTGLTGVAQAAARGAIGSALTQGVAVATGLQKNFRWQEVAVAGVIGGTINAAEHGLASVGIAGNTGTIGNYGNKLLSGAAGAIAGGAARSLMDGSDFGKNVLAALPDVIGQTIGNLVADAINGDVKLKGTPKTVALNGTVPISAGPSTADCQQTGGAPEDVGKWWRSLKKLSIDTPWIGDPEPIDNGNQPDDIIVTALRDFNPTSVEGMLGFALRLARSISSRPDTQFNYNMRGPGASAPRYSQPGPYSANSNPGAVRMMLQAIQRNGGMNSPLILRTPRPVWAPVNKSSATSLPKDFFKTDYSNPMPPSVRLWSQYQARAMLTPKYNGPDVYLYAPPPKMSMGERLWMGGKAAFHYTLGTFSGVAGFVTAETGIGGAAGVAGMLVEYDNGTTDLRSALSGYYEDTFGAMAGAKVFGTSTETAQKYYDYGQLGLGGAAAGKLGLKFLLRSGGARGALPLGMWKDVNEPMSDFSRAYQKFVTGAEGKAYEANGVKFDGVEVGAYQEAKGNYDRFVKSSTGEFYDSTKVGRGFLKQALRQTTAAGDTPINWYFAQEKSANAARILLQEKGFGNIRVIHKPYVAGK